MALKFLNKKGWHTGSLRNIENVWKAEQKHDAEQKKLDELKKQIQEERERSEFRQLQERAGLVPRQERLDFLYESGLGVGKGSSEGFKALQAPAGSAPGPSSAAETGGASSSSKAAVPGALFEDKPQSANDAWRKLHSDPLLLIRQREQEALARIKNNPVQMAIIRKSVDAEKKQKEKGSKKDRREKKEQKKMHHQDRSKHGRHSSKARSDHENSEEDPDERNERDQSTYERHGERKSRHDKHYSVEHSDSKYLPEMKMQRNRDQAKHVEASERMEGRRQRDHPSHDERYKDLEGRRWRDRPTSEQDLHKKSMDRGHGSRVNHDSDTTFLDKEDRGKDVKQPHENRYSGQKDVKQPHENRYSGRDNGSENKQSGYKRVPKLSEEERAARLREMQLNAELHEEQRWKRLKTASEAEARELNKDMPSLGGSNFLDAAKKSIYGAEKGGSSTIEESVRRRTYYLQRGSAASENNAFRR